MVKIKLHNGNIMSTKSADCNSSTQYPHKYLNDYSLKTDAMATLKKSIENIFILIAWLIFHACY